MHTFFGSAMFFALIVLLVTPFPASAFGISFGGRVLSAIPCSGGMLQVTIKPAGRFPIFYIWTPATVTKLVGPPTLGGQVLGLADFPWVCFIGGGGFFSSPIPLFGLRMQVVGTSRF